MKNLILLLLVFGMLLCSSSACRNPKAKDQTEHKEGDGDGHEHKHGDGHEHKNSDGHEHKDGDDHKN